MAAFHVVAAHILNTDVDSADSGPIAAAMETAQRYVVPLNPERAIRAELFPTHVHQVGRGEIEVERRVRGIRAAHLCLGDDTCERRLGADAHAIRAPPRADVAICTHRLHNHTIALLVLERTRRLSRQQPACKPSLLWNRPMVVVSVRCQRRQQRRQRWRRWRSVRAG